MNRRAFLQAAALAAAATPWRVWALPAASQPRLLVVMLRGAYDATSVVVPYSAPFYYAARPTLAIAAPAADNPAAALELGGGYGLHPALAASIYPLYQARQALFVPFSGSQDTSRSHFQAQDMLELGQDPHDHGGLNYTSGFLNRLVGVLQGRGMGGIAFTRSLTPVFKGALEIPNVTVQGARHAPMNARRSAILQRLYQGQPLENYVDEGMATRQQVSSLLETEMVNASRGAVKAAGFSQTARTIASLMRDKPAYGIGFVDVGGWDTHVNQGGAEGMLANNLHNLGDGLAQFADTLGTTAWRNTVVVVVSEFGRTFRENGNRGTDHGHGSAMWLLGGGISGGKLAGEQLALNETSLNQNRDLPVLNDYRAVLGNLLQRLYGLNVTQVQQVFPGVRVRDFSLV
jgi:uncharacterized protein (DUF1501 family)